jgi:hypothetical protein
MSRAADRQGGISELQEPEESSEIAGGIHLAMIA